MKKTVSVFIFLVMLTSMSIAKEKNKIGLNFNVNSSWSIGVNFNLTKHFTLRTKTGFISQKTKLESLTDNRSTSGNDNSISMGLGLLYYLFKKANISGYTGCEFIYTRLKRGEDYKNNEYDNNIMFGLQYKIVKNLWVYGEVGLTYRKERVSGSLICTPVICEETNAVRDTWSFKTSALGFIFYF